MFRELRSGREETVLEELSARDVALMRKQRKQKKKISSTESWCCWNEEGEKKSAKTSDDLQSRTVDGG